MILSISLDGDGAWKDLADKAVINGQWTGVAALAAGMVGGNPSVAIRVELEDGRVVFAETSLALFLSAADAFRVRYGDPRAGR